MEFGPILAFFIDYGHIYVPKGAFWGSKSKPHIGDLVMSLFCLLWGRPFMTGDGPKVIHFGPKIAKHGRLVNGSKESKRNQNGQPKYFWPFGTLFGPIWTLLDHFKQKFILCSGASPPNPTLSIWGKKFMSEMVLDMSCFWACLLSVSHSCLINILPWNEFLFEEGSAADVFEDLS